MQNHWKDVSIKTMSNDKMEFIGAIERQRQQQQRSRKKNAKVDLSKNKKKKNI